MSQHQSKDSFSIKPSHEFVDPNPMQDDISATEQKYSLDSTISSLGSSSSTTSSQTSYSSRHKQNNGFSVQTTETSLEDYY